MKSLTFVNSLVVLSRKKNQCADFRGIVNSLVVLFRKKKKKNQCADFRGIPACEPNLGGNRLKALLSLKALLNADPPFLLGKTQGNP